MNYIIELQHGESTERYSQNNRMVLAITTSNSERINPVYDPAKYNSITIFEDGEEQPPFIFKSYSVHYLSNTDFIISFYN